MKKRIISLILALSMVLGMTACGKKEPNASMIITIEEKQYDLSGDFQEVVGQMVTDGIVVFDFEGTTTWLYDESGHCAESEVPERQVYARASLLYPDIGLVMNSYGITRKTSYETVDGVTNNSTLEEIAALENHIQMGNFYYALYTDGKQVDFESFRDTYDAYLSATEELVLKEATEQYFPVGPTIHIRPGNSLYQSMTIDNCVGQNFRTLVETGLYWEPTLLVMLAAADAYELLKKGVIESYDIIIYSQGDVTYEHYFYDPNGTESKYNVRQ